MIIKLRLGRITQAIQLHTRLIQVVLLADNIRRGDAQRILLARRQAHDFLPGALERRRPADEHRGFEQRRRVRFGVFREQGERERRALREAHHGVEGAFLLDDVQHVGHCELEFGAGRRVAAVVVVERAFADACELYIVRGMLVGECEGEA